MNSSTSVSKNTRRGLLAAIIMVLIGEFAIRLAMPSLSGDAMHIRSIPQIARALEENQGIKLLFLGNSTINNGIKVDVLEKEFERLNPQRSIVTAKINPDGTDIWDWHFLYKNNFLKKSIAPDIVLVGFIRDLLDDQRPANMSRLAGDFCRINDFKELMTFDLSGLSSIKEFLMASVSTLFSNRSTIRNRLLDFIIPFFREGTSIIHKSEREMELKSGTRHVQFAISYAQLAKFIDMVKSQGNRMVLIAMPTKDGYDLHKELLATIETHEAIILDMRHVNRLSKEHFADSVHLHPEGARILSHELAKRMAPMLLRKTGFFANDLLFASERPWAVLRGDFN